MKHSQLSNFLLVLLLSIFLWNCASEIPALKSPESSKKAILTFKFLDFTPAVDGDIDTAARTVKLRVPVATKVTALVPTITLSASAKVTPASLIPQNFTVPITYMVTAADCTKRAYTVSVDVARTTDPEIIGIETLSIKTTESFFVYGKNFTRATPLFYLTSKLTGKIYNLNTVAGTLKATEAKVQVPFDVPVGLYSISVNVAGRVFKYRTLDLKVTGTGKELIINRMTVLSYIRGNTLVITGNNIKAQKAQIRFVPQIASTTQLKDAIINTAGTEISYKIETTFPAPNRWSVAVLLDGVAYALPDLITITAR
jgi:hypothetical protein